MIKLSIGELHGLARDFQQLSEEMNGQAGAFKALTADIAAGWEGEAATAFVELGQGEIAPRLTRTVEILAAAGRELERVAAEFEEAERQAAAAVRAVTGL